MSTTTATAPMCRLVAIDLALTYTTTADLVPAVRVFARKGISRPRYATMPGHIDSMIARVRHAFDLIETAPHGVCVIADGYVCTDCMMMMANGEVADPDASPGRVEDIATATAGWCAAEDEAHPSGQGSGMCRTCRTLLYGDRHWAVRLA